MKLRIAGPCFKMPAQAGAVLRQSDPASLLSPRRPQGLD